MKRYLLFFSMSFLSWSGTSLADEIVHYKNDPVTILLNKGEERTIQFGDHVQIGLTKGQQIKKLFRVQSAQGAVHILPYEEFDKQRVQIKRITDGQVILLDLISTNNSSNVNTLEKVRVLLASENTVREADKSVENEDTNLPVITPVDLTRFAAQRLYGPSRLYNDRPGITETALGIKTAIRLFKGKNKYQTVSKPIVAFQGGGYYLAGIHVKNISDEVIQLDYLDLNLPFSHATFQHHSLRPNGSPGDSTVLYLISEKALQETLYPWTYYKDLKADAEEALRLEEEQDKSHSRKHPKKR